MFDCYTLISLSDATILVDVAMAFLWAVVKVECVLLIGAAIECGQDWGVLVDQVNAWTVLVLCSLWAGLLSGAWILLLMLLVELTMLLSTVGLLARTWLIMRSGMVEGQSLDGTMVVLAACLWSVAIAW